MLRCPTGKQEKENRGMRNKMNKQKTSNKAADLSNNMT